MEIDPILKNEEFEYENRKYDWIARINFEENILRGFFEETNKTGLDCLNIYFDDELNSWVAQIYYKSDYEDIIRLPDVDCWFDAARLTALKIGIPVRQ
jgi:hypothetical protein